jgi:hypothetical protein
MKIQPSQRNIAFGITSQELDSLKNNLLDNPKETGAVLATSIYTRGNREGKEVINRAKAGLYSIEDDTPLMQKGLPLEADIKINRGRKAVITYESVIRSIYRALAGIVKDDTDIIRSDGKIIFSADQLKTALKPKKRV